MLIRVIGDFKGVYTDHKNNLYEVYELVKQEKISRIERVIIGLCTFGLTEIANLSYGNFNKWHKISTEKIKYLIRYPL